MDAVITYVDGCDPLWQKDYAEYVGGSILAKRFRDWGTLKFVFRGIQMHMPYIEKVHLVVARESQVPEWVDRENVHVVFHSDFIPAEYLPTFNCNTLEMYLHRIPGLAEQYIYFNDDLFPLRDIAPDTFFRDGKVVVHHTRHILALNLFKKLIRKSDSLAKKLAGVAGSPVFVRPQHTCSAMLRSNCEEVFSKGRKEILDSLSRTRNEHNFNQYLFSDYLYYLGKTIDSRISNRHFSLAVADSSKICSFIASPQADIACINDVEMSDVKFESLRKDITEAFEKAFPEKSKYELI